MWSDGIAGVKNNAAWEHPFSTKLSPSELISVDFLPHHTLTNTEERQPFVFHTSFHHWSHACNCSSCANRNNMPFSREPHHWALLLCQNITTTFLHTLPDRAESGMNDCFAADSSTSMPNQSAWHSNCRSLLWWIACFLLVKQWQIKWALHIQGAPVWQYKIVTITTVKYPRLQKTQPSKMKEKYFYLNEYYPFQTDKFSISLSEWHLV